eukprot:8977306-Heterocapsa_arctica.AAC.1
MTLNSVLRLRTDFWAFPGARFDMVHLSVAPFTSYRLSACAGLVGRSGQNTCPEISFVREGPVVLTFEFLWGG